MVRQVAQLFYLASIICYIWYIDDIKGPVCEICILGLFGNVCVVPVHSQDRRNEAGPPTQNIHTGKRTTSQHIGRAHR